MKERAKEKREQAIREIGGKDGGEEGKGRG